MYRTIILGLRASVCRDPKDWDSKSNADYMQITFGMGYLLLSQDLVSIFRCVLVNSTKGPNPTTIKDIPLTKFDYSASASETDFYGENEQDHPRERNVYRRICDCLAITLWIAMGLGAYGDGTIASGLDSEKKAKLTGRFRWVARAFLRVLSNARTTEPLVHH